MARAATRLTSTTDGRLKGKVRYMAPEQLAGEATRQTDVYAAGVVLWEALTSQRLFKGDTEAQLLTNVMHAEIPPPRQFNPDVPPGVERAVLKAIAKEPQARWPTAQDMAYALDQAIRPASAIAVGQWVQQLVGPALAQKAALVQQAESGVNPHGVVAPMRSEGSLPQIDGPYSNSSLLQVGLARGYPGAIRRERRACPRGASPG